MSIKIIFVVSCPELFSLYSFSQDSGLEEVTVTAQRQEQSLQDVPLAVSALSEDDLFDNKLKVQVIFN